MASGGPSPGATVSMPAVLRIEGPPPFSTPRILNSRILFIARARLATASRSSSFPGSGRPALVASGPGPEGILTGRCLAIIDLSIIRSLARCSWGRSCDMLGVWLGPSPVPCAGASAPLLPDGPQDGRPQPAEGPGGVGRPQDGCPSETPPSSLSSSRKASACEGGLDLGLEG